MGELLQLLTAAKSLNDQASVESVVNQHADAINQQARSVQLLQAQIDGLRETLLTQSVCFVALFAICACALFWYIHRLEKKLALATLAKE